MREKLMSVIAATCMLCGVSLLAASAPAQNIPAPAQPAQATQAEQAGSAVIAVGTVTDTAADGNSHQLHDGDPIYAGDTLTTGDNSYADLDFEDGGRMLLRPDTSFQIERYHYDPAAHGYAPAPPEQPFLAQASPSPQPLPSNQPQPAAAPTSAAATPEEHESAFFRLIKGGFSAISGFIGHVNHQDYAVETPVATIGIRGTGYEVRYCDTSCGASGDGSQQGLYTAVGKGAIGLKNDAGETVNTAGHFGYLASRHAAFQRLAALPRALQHMRLPPRYYARDMRMHQHIQAQRQTRWQQLRERRQPGVHGPRTQYPGQGRMVQRPAAAVPQKQEMRANQKAKGKKKKEKEHIHEHDGGGR